MQYTGVKTLFSVEERLRLNFCTDYLRPRTEGLSCNIDGNNSVNQIAHIFVIFLSYLSKKCPYASAAKRLPRLQPVPNPSGMVLMDRPAERAASASCCSWSWCVLHQRVVYVQVVTLCSVADFSIYFSVLLLRIVQKSPQDVPSSNFLRFCFGFSSSHVMKDEWKTLFLCFFEWWFFLIDGKKYYSCISVWSAVHLNEQLTSCRLRFTIYLCVSIHQERKRHKVKTKTIASDYKPRTFCELGWGTSE